MDSATVGMLVGGVVLGLLVMAGAGTLVVRRRKRPGATASPGGELSGPQPRSVLQRTAPLSGTHVAIHDFAFHPGHLQVAAGTTVTWTNQDDVQHTVTFRNGMADSGLLPHGQTYQYTFASPGTFAYYCAVHPHMVGTVQVTSA